MSSSQAYMEKSVTICAVFLMARCRVLVSIVVGELECLRATCNPTFSDDNHVFIAQMYSWITVLFRALHTSKPRNHTGECAQRSAEGRIAKWIEQSFVNRCFLWADYLHYGRDFIAAVVRCSTVDSGYVKSLILQAALLTTCNPVTLW